MNVTKKMKSVFPEWAIADFPHEAKTHVPRVDSDQIRGLAEIAKNHEVCIKRSGTGLTVIASKSQSTTI